MALPKNWDIMKVPHQLKVTFDVKKFLVMKERLPGRNDIILGFSSKSGIETMRRACLEMILFK